MGRGACGLLSSALSGRTTPASRTSLAPYSHPTCCDCLLSWPSLTPYSHQHAVTACSPGPALRLNHFSAVYLVIFLHHLLSHPAHHAMSHPAHHALCLLMQVAPKPTLDGRRTVSNADLRRLREAHPCSRATGWELLADHTITLCLTTHPGDPGSSAGKGAPSPATGPATGPATTRPACKAEAEACAPRRSVRQCLRLQVGEGGGYGY